MRSLCHKAHSYARECFFPVVPYERPCPNKKKTNHLHTLHYLSSFHESAKTTAITSILEGTLPIIELTQDDQIYRNP